MTSAATAFYTLLFLLFSLMSHLLFKPSEFFKLFSFSVTLFELALDFNKDLKSLLGSNTSLSLSVLMKQSLMK